MMTNDILKQLQKYYYEVGFDDGDLIQAAMKEIESLRAENERLSQPQEAVAWYTDDNLTDKSATTWDESVAKRWADKGWPVNQLYTSQPDDKAEIAKLVTERDQLLARNAELRNEVIEMCAKECDGYITDPMHSMYSDAIRNLKVKG